MNYIVKQTVNDDIYCYCNTSILCMYTTFNKFTFVEVATAINITILTMNSITVFLYFVIIIIPIHNRSVIYVVRKLITFAASCVNDYVATYLANNYFIESRD